MNKFLLLASLLLIFSFQLNFGAIYVSPTGNDTNPGTIDLPFKTIQKAVSLAGTDSLIYLRGGVYEINVQISLNKSGQPGKYIKLWAYPGEHPVLDFSSQPSTSTFRGLNITHNYWHLKGLEIKNARDNGIYIQGWYALIENCVMHHCGDTGLQISNGGSYNIIRNCDSYLNYDVATHGENADGFAPKLSIGPGNEFHGCRAYWNSDDGWDLYESNQKVLINNCWTFGNGYNRWNDPSFHGDGNGFKLGGNYVAAPHLVTRCLAFDNKGKGFDQNHNTGIITLYNCTGFRNSSRNYSLGETPATGVHVLKNCIGFTGSNSIAGNSTQVKNSWQGFTVTASDFLSIDTSGVSNQRDTSWQLPDIQFMKLNSSSLMVDAGEDVGLPFNGTAPDLGAFETGAPLEIKAIETFSDRSFIIYQNYPNPFNPVTTIRFEVAKTSNVNITLNDLLGRTISMVSDGVYNVGSHEIKLSCSDLSSGVYFVVIHVDGVRSIMKINLLK